MGYDSTKALAGRIPYTIIEIEAPYITDVLAAENPDGSGPCFNTPATAIGFTGYTVSNKTYTFGDENKQVPAGMSLLPSLIKYENRSPRIAPAKAEGIGMRGGAVITVQDGPHHDRDTDPYVSERSYIPEERGTYWGKWLARNPYYHGSTLRVRQGYIVDGAYNADNFRDATYHIEGIDGPDSRGRVTIRCSDILQFTDGDRAQAPRVSSGRLLTDIDAVTTTATLTPEGAGDGYATSGILRIDDELVDFTRVDDVLTMTRASYNTTSDTHSEDTRAQECILWTAINILDIVYDLLVNHAGINPVFVDKLDWEGSTSGWLSLHNLTAIISEPEGVNTLLAELSEQCLFYLWWDAEAALVRMRAVAPQVGTLKTISDTTEILAGTGRPKHNTKDRLTDVVMYIGLRTPVSSLTKSASFTDVVELPDDEAATNYGSRKIRTIYSRWFLQDHRALAVIAVHRIASRFRDGTKSLTVDVDAKDDNIILGDPVAVHTQRIQDSTGGNDGAVAMQVVEARRHAEGDRITLMLETWSFAARYCLIAPASMDSIEYATASDEQKNIYGFISPSSGKFADGTNSYVIG